MSTTVESIVSVSGLEVRYSGGTALDKIDFQILPREVVGLLGPNGAGKTTTVETLEGFRIPSGGSVRVLGADPVTAGEDWRSRIGLVLQHWQDHANWRVREFLVMVAAHYRRYGGAWDPDDLLDLVGLSEHGRRRIIALSGGQRRRLDLAAGIVGSPELLFLDEPTAGLDPQARREFHDLIERVNTEMETTILLTSHDLHEVERLSDRVLILVGGEVVADGTVDELTAAVAGSAEVRWTQDGERRLELTDDPVGLIRRLDDKSPGSLTQLEVRQADLETAYLSLVKESETQAANDRLETLKGAWR